ncbi:MAG: hypothetical protein CMJ58_22615 [Planctomycetaceae bacterium]|nr:hypothetical protein [Planctomycetaceae bacterium]
MKRKPLFPPAAAIATAPACRTVRCVGAFNQRGGMAARAKHKLRSPDPTPEEIAKAAAKIRSRWSAAERERRLRVDWRNGEAELHRLSTGDLQAAAQAARR